MREVERIEKKGQDGDDLGRPHNDRTWPRGFFPLLSRVGRVAPSLVETPACLPRPIS